MSSTVSLSIIGCLFTNWVTLDIRKGVKLNLSFFNELHSKYYKRLVKASKGLSYSSFEITHEHDCILACQNLYLYFFCHFPYFLVFILLHSFTTYSTIRVVLYDAGREAFNLASGFEVLQKGW